MVSLFPFTPYITLNLNTDICFVSQAYFQMKIFSFFLYIKLLSNVVVYHTSSIVNQKFNVLLRFQLISVSLSDI